MFGTGRTINDIVLKIFKIEGDSKKEDGFCSLWGGVSYTFDNDFTEETTDDILMIHLWLSPDKFNNLAETIKTKKVDSFELDLSKVSGFYSEWSPSISTNNIKVLTADKTTQKISIPPKCKIIPPRLKGVNEFNISIIQRNKLNPKQDLRGIDINSLFEEQEEIVEDDWDDDISEETEANTLLLGQLSRNELALDKLQTPLWLISIVLILLFLYLVFHKTIL
ncbi:MAG: hypothetical protein OFPII_43270 [Osedax symbiont Rs1]|nr:MAG: hypothetical protein OFPII_43270 [Osedax symbiont Rs1]